MYYFCKSFLKIIFKSHHVMVSYNKVRLDNDRSNLERRSQGGKKKEEEEEEKQRKQSKSRCNVIKLLPRAAVSASFF